MTAAPLDLSPKQLSADEMDEIKTFVVESWSPYRTSFEQSYLESLLRHIACLEEQGG